MLVAAMGMDGSEVDRPGASDTAETGRVVLPTSTQRTQTSETARAEDVYGGAWQTSQISQYVYEADGSFVGVIRQRRVMQPQADGVWRVLLQGSPDAALTRFPLGDLRGEWQYSVRRDGRTHLYEGPDVRGVAQAWGNRAIVGRAVWPRLGFAARMLSIVVAPDRELSVQRFYVGNQLIAQMLGVAVPFVLPTSPDITQSEATLPTLGNEAQPWEVSRMWHGSAQLFSAEGDLTRDVPHYERVFSDNGWTNTVEGEPTEEMLFVWRAGGTRFEAISETTRGRWGGIGRSAGHVLELDGVFERTPETSTDYLGLLDAEGRYFVGLRRMYSGEMLTHLAVEVLRPV